MEFESLRDQKGKEHLVFNASEFNEEESIGDKKDDFEFLQLLGQGGFGNVFKVSSLINHKVYAMKILDLEEKEGEGISKEIKEKYFISEIELLKNLKHPNICKYYKSFREKDKLYIIMEYFDNGDLQTYIKVLKNYSKQKEIKKDEIWNIFYQCLSGLDYLHNTGVVHRDLKPQNIFMTKNKIIKIGDFGVSALIKEKKNMEKIHKIGNTFVGSYEYMAPEIYKRKEDEARKYNEKIDIYSMGCIFYKLCYLKDYQKMDYVREGNNFVQKLVSGEISQNIDNNFLELISKMLEEDPQKRPDSKTIFEMVKENYNKIFIQNSGLYSVIRCMINLPYLRTNYLTKYKSSREKPDENKEFSEKFLFCIENQNNWIENLTFYRHKIIEENNFLNNNKEINPYLIFTFILDKLHGELNKVIKAPDINLLKKRSSNIDALKEDKIKREYISSFSANFNSNISTYFVGHMESIRDCSKCKIQTYLFTYFFSLDFDLNLPLFAKKGKKEIDLIELFKFQNDICLDLKGLKKLQCVKCKEETEHKESKIFYLFPYQLVLAFDRGNDYENKTKINYPEKLDLSDISKDKKYSPKIFDLVGVIKRCDIGTKEHYISLILNSEEKSWYLYDNENRKKISSQSEYKDGDVIMLFYVAPKKNN